MVKPIKKRIQPNGGSPRKTKFVCGVYEILHRPSKRRYVGSSIEVEKRLYLHVCQLRIGTHHCGFLQNVWNKYGEDGFEFFLLEVCEPSRLAEREQFHMDATAKGSLLNSQPIARSCVGFKVSEAAKLKMSEAAKRFAANPEERRRRSERAKAQHAAGNLGWATMTEEGKSRVRKIGSAAMKKYGHLGIEAAKATQTSEEMSRRSYLRKMFQ